MEWSRVLKPRTVENALMQVVVGVVFFTGYFIIETIREKRDIERLKEFRQQKKYS